MRLALLALLSVSLASAAVVVSGTFKNPDGTNFSGKVVISYPRPTATNTCSTPAQVVAVRPVTVVITNGNLGTLSLYATSCLNPATPYTVKVYDSRNNVVYSDQWNVPNQGSADVTQCSVKDR